jgi:hypothetical protein
MAEEREQVEEAKLWPLGFDKRNVGNRLDLHPGPFEKEFHSWEK